MADRVVLKADTTHLIAALKDLRREIQRYAIKRAGRAGAYLFLQEAKRLVQVKSGLLKNDLRIRQRMKNDEADFSVGTSRKAPHAHLVELGTRPHRIPTPNGSPFSVPGGWIDHPGARPFPFLRPAFDSKKDEAGEKAIDILWKHIEKVSSKYRNRAPVNLDML